VYSIVGADGADYGPVESATLVQWAREGRVVAKTTVLDHATGRRFLACDLAELAPIFDGTLVAAGRSDLGPSYRTAPPVMVEPILPPTTLRRRNRIVAGLLGVFLGAWGVHRFYLGYTSVGTAMLVLGLTGCGTVGTAVWGFVEGVLCLLGAMNDADGQPLING
jgi:TM2 domain-containing membrane protein YozV